MKAKFPLILILAIFSLWQTNSNAQCDANNDFVQWGDSNWYDIDIPNDSRPDNVGQTFIATCTGPIRGTTLVTDNVRGGNIGGVSMTAELWLNPFSSSRVLMASQTQDINFHTIEGSDEEDYFPFSSLPQVTAGEEYAVVFTLNDTQYTVGVDVQLSNFYPEGNFIRDWSTTGTGSWDLRTRVHYEDNVAPEANCKNITRALDANNTLLNLNATAINNNSTDADSGIATRFISKSTFDCNDVGYNSVRLIVTDQNGNSDVCESVVFITDGNDPVLTCPGDMTVTADYETGTAIVNYADVTYDDCTFEWADGFDFIGTHDGRSYFVSHTPLVPSEAFANAELQGGHVTTVIDAEHNEWLRAAVNNQGLTNEDILIGYNDVTQEDTFVWHNPNGGSTYENWATLEPNNSGPGAGEDYTIMNGGGRWNDVNNNTARHYILEKSEANIRQSSGLVSGSEFPVGTTINYFSATDAFGNTGNCFFIVEVLPAPIETTVVLDNGELIITDVLNESSDQITFSSDGTTLTISDLIDPSVSGGPTLVDLTTVTVPLASITNGIVFNSGNGGNTGFNIITFANDLTLTGVDNDITLNGLRGYVQTGSINIEGDLTINGIGFGLTLFGFDLTLGEITANNLNIDGVDRILDELGSPLTISGDTQLLAADGINIENYGASHTFVGEVNLTSGELIFSAGADTTFGDINATDQGVGVSHTLLVSGGDITFNGDVTILGSNATLNVVGVENITQTGGGIEAPNLIFKGTENTAVSIDNNNNIQSLETINFFEALGSTAVDLGSLSYTNTTNMVLGTIDVNEFNLTAPQLDFEPGVTNIRKRGSGVSNFNANIDVINGTGTASINHNAGTINFNGDTNDFLSQMTYVGLPETITNINSLTTDFPAGGPNRLFTFGTLNATGAIDAGDIDINLFNGANFSLNTTSLTGVPYVQGALTNISGGAKITPGGGTTGLEYSFDDLTINTGATFAPFIEGTGVSEFDKLAVNGTLTLDDANLAPTGGYVIGPDDELIIIDNDGTDDAVVGTFNDLPEGREVIFGDFVGMISYEGGDGNDVVLIPLLDTEVNLTGGTLTIEDINGGLSNDNITLSNDGTTLIISDLIAPVKIVGAVTPVTETSVSVPLASITNGFQFLSEGGVDSITINNALTLSGSDNFFIADNIDNYTQNAALTVGGSIWLSGTDTSNILFGEITASNLNLIEFNNVDDSDGKRLNISGQVSMRTLGTVNIDNGSGNESDHFFGGLVDIEAALVSNFTTGSDLSISIRTTATNGINNIIASPGAITVSGTTTTAGDSDINLSATSITQLADVTITTDELIITANGNNPTVELLNATNDINLLTSETLLQSLSITDVDDIELGDITVDEFTITAPTINMTSETDFTKIGVGVGNFVGFSFSNEGTGSITQSGGTIIFNGDTVLFGGITYNGSSGTTTKFTGGQTFIGDNFTFGTLLVEDRFVIEALDEFNLLDESNVVTVLDQTIVGNDVGPDFIKIFGGYGTFTGSPTTISTNGEILPFTFGSLTFENDLRIENGAKFNAQLFGIELDDYSRINVTGTVTLDNAELDASFNILSNLVGPGFELVIIDNDGVDPIVGTFNGFPEGSMIETSQFGTIKTGTLSYTLGDGNDFGWKYDDVVPTAVCQDITINIEGSEIITVTGDQLDGGATDNTEITEILIDGQASLDFTSADIGDHEVTITFADTNGNTSECMATITLVPIGITVSPKVYLQGAFLNPNQGEEDLMRDDLRVAGLLPTVSPYDDALRTDSLTFLDGFFATINDNIVDWVWVELRDATDNTNVIDGQSALLQRDGDVVGIDGVSPLSFSQPADNYYIVIKHRNHLGIMSNSAIDLNGTATVVDFTDGSTATYGSNAQATFGMPTGIQGMWAGDADSDGNVNFSFDGNKVLLDLLLHLNNTTFSSSYTEADGYLDADIDLNGNISLQDDLNNLLLNVLFYPSNTSFSSSYGLFDEQLPEIQTLKAIKNKANSKEQLYIQQKINEIQSKINK
ncbi:MAG: lectin-like protein [Algibacter sp.]